MVKHVHRQIRVERKKLNNVSSVSIIKFNTFSLHDLVFDFKNVAFFLSQNYSTLLSEVSG
jgi:hypothetical protein